MLTFSTTTKDRPKGGLRAVVKSLSYSTDGTSCILKLEPLEPGGISNLDILNVVNANESLSDLIGQTLWGDSSRVYIRDKVLGNRRSYESLVVFYPLSKVISKGETKEPNG